MFQFSQPDYLYLLFAVPLLLLLLFYAIQRKKALLRKYADTPLHTVLMNTKSYKKEGLKAVLLSVVFALLVFALAEPQMGSKVEEVKQVGIDVYILLDVSHSMHAEDLKPNRLENAKHAITTMIKRLQGDRIGLIIFAGAAYVQFPLTTDYSAANLFLSTVNTESIPQPGTDIASAIDLATNSFKKSSEEMQKVIIIITDGEDHEGGVDRAIESAVNQDVVIYTIGMGSANGAPIPVYDNSGRRTGYKKDSEGEVVLTKLNEEMLKNIAAQGNGKYYYSTGDQDELNMIYSDLAGLDKTEFGSKRITEYEDRFYWFLIPAVLLLFIEFFITDRKLKWASALFRAIEKGNKKRL